MSDQKISELTNITGANLANADEFVVVDVSADQTKAVTREEFFKNTPNITVDGDVIIGDDLFVSGPNPVINIVETGVNQHRILGTGGSLYIQAQDSDGTTDGDIHLTGYNNNDLGLLRIKAANTTISGDLTIGDDLFITGPNPAIYLTDDDDANEWSQIANSSGNTFYIARNGVDKGQHIFQQNAGGVTTEAMRINTFGRVGIGETTPDMKLHIKDASNAYVKLEDSGGVLGGAASAGVRMYTGASEQGQMGFMSTASGIMRLNNLQGSLYLDADSNDAHTNSFMRFAVDNSEAMRIDSSGDVGIGITGPTEKLHVAGNAIVSGDVSIGDDLFMTGPSPNIFMNDSDGTNQQTQIIQSGGNTYFRARNEASDGSFIFQGYGGGSATEFVKIVSNGRVGINEANPSQALEVNGAIVAQTGIYLGGEATANKLDDYEEGTWTPTIAFGGASAGVTYLSNTGRYTKIGNSVTIWWGTALSAKGSSTGNLTIAGLPFLPDIPGGYMSPNGVVKFKSCTSISGSMMAQVSSSNFLLIQDNSATATSLVTNANLSNSSWVLGSVTYKV